MQLEGKRVLITGASSGIGRALATEFARHSAILALVARRTHVLAEVAREIGTANMPLIIGCDVTDSACVERMMATCRDALGGIDILINNAGISIYGASDRTLLADFRALMEVNFIGAVNCSLGALPLMKNASHGLIVNISSVAALHGVPYLGAYGASKAALAAFGQSLRAELKSSGIAVLNVYPYYTRSPLFDHEKLVGGAHRPQQPYADVSTVARQIVQAVGRERKELVLSGEGKALFVLRGLVPSLIDRKMQHIADRLRDRKEPTHA
jgi:short-subunit dehydrogenase